MSKKFSEKWKEEKEANQLIEDARLLEKIGCFAIVLENFHLVVPWLVLF